MTYERTCPDCRTTYTAKHRGKRPRCQRCANRIKMREWMRRKRGSKTFVGQEATCGVCTRKFQRRSGNHKHCCLKCRQHASYVGWLRKRGKKPKRISTKLAMRRAAAIRQEWSESRRRNRLEDFERAEAAA